MIFLSDSTDDNETVARELQCEVGQLITPLSRRSDRGCQYGIDNGAFSPNFSGKSFLSILERQKGATDRCFFVAVPDVVGSARRTNEAFYFWYDKILSVSKDFPIAYVAQDGVDRVVVPWDRISAIFIGGTTKFKNSDECKAVIGAARVFCKYVHAGRINTPDRWDFFESLGVDSCDGTGLSQFSHMRVKVALPGLYDEYGGRLD